MGRPELYRRAMRFRERIRHAIVLDAQTSTGTGGSMTRSFSESVDKAGDSTNSQTVDEAGDLVAPQVLRVRRRGVVNAGYSVNETAKR